MEKPNRCISVTAAKVLQEEWWKTRLEVTTNGNKHKDTCEFHFTIDELQQYLDYVKSESEANNIQNPGINIWLGAYKANENKPNLTTLFISATKKRSTEPPEGDDRDYEENTEIEPFNIIHGGYPPIQY